MTDDLVLGARHFPRVAALLGQSAAGIDGSVPMAQHGRASTPMRAVAAVPLSAPVSSVETAPAGLAPGLSADGPDARLRPLAEQVAEVERAALAAALAATGGNRVATARLLRMSRAALYERLARWPELGARRGPTTYHRSTPPPVPPPLPRHPPGPPTYRCLSGHAPPGELVS